MRSIAFLALFPLTALAADPLSQPLQKWKAEIERLGPHRVVVVRVSRDREQNTISIPPGAEERELVKRYLNREEIVRQFVDTHALLISHHEESRFTHLVLLNLDRRAEWVNEDPIIAHEFGHAWLKALSYPAPLLQDSPTACLGIHTGNIVQHILIREEMKRRGFDYEPDWIRDLTAMLDSFDKTPDMPVEPCKRVRLAALWVDVRLGLTDERWPGRPRLERVLSAGVPWMKSFVDQIDEYLHNRDVKDKSVHREALGFVFQRLKLVAQGTEMASVALK